MISFFFSKALILCVDTKSTEQSGFSWINPSSLKVTAHPEKVPFFARFFMNIFSI